MAKSPLKGYLLLSRGQWDTDNWFIVAGSLEEAAAIVAESPCLACGLTYEIRPIDPERGSAYRTTSETPSRAG